MKDIVIIGGPNGAGKTTAAPAVVPQELGIREFINADEIARGLSPFNAEHDALVRSGESFAFETTCSGRAYAGWLQKCKLAGWRVTLLFLWLPSPQAALDRVARRVREGGHGIPSDVVIRRYKTGAANMRHLYLPLADVAAIYDNSDAGRVLIAERIPGVPLTVHDAARWAMIERTSP